MSETMQKKIICRAPDCHFEVRDTEEEELILMTQDHAQRKHQVRLPEERLRAAIQPVEGSNQESHEEGQ